MDDVRHQKEEIFQPRSNSLRIYTIPGRPIPLQRARHSRGHVYDPQKDQKLITGLILKQQHGSLPLFDGPLIVTFTFTFKRQPKSTANYHHFKPDASNLLKYYEDVAIGILWHDDCLLSQITVLKQYGTVPNTVITVYPVRSI